MKLQFSGHDSFICKHFWLKKGYDFLQNGQLGFNDEQAVVELGIGRNMVTALSYWLKSYAVVDNINRATAFGHYLFHAQTGRDPYLESLGSIWLLHYSLIRTAKASIYTLFFNEFRKEKLAFTKEHLSAFIYRQLNAYGQGSISSNTVQSDIAVFIRNYLSREGDARKIDLEDEFTNLFVDLQLMESYQAENAQGKMVEWYSVYGSERRDLPAEVLLFSILDNDEYGNSISFQELLTGANSPGLVFALNDEGLFGQIEQLQIKYPDTIIYKETAGIRELQFRTKPNKWRILDDYYQA